MCQVTPTTQTMEQPNALTVRRSALSRRTRARLCSFCLPKEATSALLQNDFPEDEPENDTSRQEKSAPLNRRVVSLKRNKQRMTSLRMPKEQLLQMLNDSAEWSSEELEQESEPESDVQENPLSRRKLALKRNKQRMTSLRVSKEQLQHMLNDSSEWSWEELDLESEPATITTPEPREDNPKLRRVRAMQNHKAKTRMNSFRLPKENTKPLLRVQADEQPEEDSDKSRRCLALQQHKQKMRLTAFRLPKEATKDLLHWSAEEEEDSTMTAIPRRVIRQSSFSARSA